MPYEAQLARMKEFADVLVRIVSERTQGMRIADALEAAAAQLRTAISQIKYGLSYALNTALLKLRDGLLTATA
jgi:hypothetical protein